MTSQRAIVTLVVFIISTVFIICPISIPTPHPLPRIRINLTTAPILAIALLWAAQCLDPTVIRNGIVGTEGVKPYNILILFLSLAYMSITLDVKGIFHAVAIWVGNKGGCNGWKLYLYFYVMLTLLSVLLGNEPVILSGTVFLVRYTKVADLNPVPWIMAEFAAANTASMVLFVGNPTNVIICEGLGVDNAAFTAYTLLPFLACNIFCFLALVFQYRNWVPRKLSRTPYLDPRSVLRDPFGAIVGSFMLGATIILCLVASFLGVDAWATSLPFAVAIFLFDICWDHYRYSHGMLDRGSPRAVEEGHNESPAIGVSFPSDECTAVDSHPQTWLPPDEGPDESQSPAVEKCQRVGDTSSFPLSSTNRSHLCAEDIPSSPPRSYSSGRLGCGSPQAVEEGPGNSPAVEERQCVGDTASSYSSSTDGSHQCAEDTPSSYSSSTGEEQQPSSLKDEETAVETSYGPQVSSERGPHPPPLKAKTRTRTVSRWHRSKTVGPHVQCFPTFLTVLPRLPFALIPFVFSQFILIEALDHQGWVNVFADWLVRASHKQPLPTIWLIGIISIILGNFSGNICATILLTRVVRAAALPYDANRGAAIALAVASNIGAVNFTFSASLVGLLWRSLSAQEGIHVRGRDFAFWNFFPLLAMTTTGLGVVSAEMAVLFSSPRWN